MPDELTEVVERVEIGWDREKARETLSESMQTISVASRLARKAVMEIESTSQEIEPDIITMKGMISAMRAEGISSGRQSGTCTRSQAQKIISSCNKILACFDVNDIVRMSLDLTNQSRIFIEMMDRIDKRYGAEDRQQQEDITRWLTEGQLMMVMGWIRENKTEGMGMASET